jgi:hypothetical protein
MEQDIAQIVQDIENEQALGRVSGVQVFRSTLNQPALISISSANSTDVGTTDGYYTFNINLPRPALHVGTLQLLDAVIPLPTANIPDTACTFWYYRLSAYSGLNPNPANLYFNRLLPSYYKQELIINPSNYGFNETFNTYSNVATQLALANSNDLAANNQLIAYLNGQPTTATSNLIQYIPNDISLTYDSNINKFQFTGQNATTPFATTAWSNATTYASNDVVYFSNSNTIPNTATYQSLQAANSNRNPYTQTTWWKRIYTDIVKAWDIDTQYRQGQLVYYAATDRIYVAQYDTHLNGPSTDALQTWSALRYYQLNDYVIFVGNAQGYRCIRPNTAIDPTSVSGPSYWTRAEWNNLSIYPINCRIYHTATNKVYQSLIANNLNNTPGSSTAWKDIGTAVVWIYRAPNTFEPNYRYVPTGYNDSNVLLNQATGKLQWSPFAVYEAGATIQYGGVDYTALQQNQNYIPFPITSYTTWSATANYAIGSVVSYTAPSSSAQFFLAIAASLNQYPSGGSAFWQPQLWTTSGVAPIVGLNAISSTYDFMFVNNGTTRLGFPYGIPGQPFNPAPRRLLNSILGFTFNGQFPPLAFYVDPFGTSVPQVAFNYYRRMRPIPLVALFGGEEVLGTNYIQSATTQTYTAEGYANLVYTSIVSVYATVVGSSTLNTQRNTNLLGIVNMNAANLGVGFHQNYMDDALKVFHNDIYTIGIELRDEADEPYILTNNAITTFTMKLTYKE